MTLLCLQVNHVDGEQCDYFFVTSDAELRRAVSQIETESHERGLNVSCQYWSLEPATVNNLRRFLVCCSDISEAGEDVVHLDEPLVLHEAEPSFLDSLPTPSPVSVPPFIARPESFRGAESGCTVPPL